MIPSRPWRTVSGVLDTVVDDDGALVARGWIVDDRDSVRPTRPVDEAWLIVGEQPAFVLAPEPRGDVSAAFGSRATGFTGRGAATAASGKHTFGILARASDGTGIVARRPLLHTVSEPPLPFAPPHDERPLERDSVFLLREDADARAGALRHDIRAGFELLVRGRVAGDEPAYVRIRSARVDRWYELHLTPFEPVRGDVPERRFEAYLRTSDLPPDGYRADLYAGFPARPARTARFVICAGGELPLALRAFAHAPRAELGGLRSAYAVRSDRDAESDSFVAGEPVWMDGVLHARVAAAFAAVDDLRPIAIPHSETAVGLTRFAAVVQTADLCAGLHRVEVRLVPPIGNGYYVAGSRTFRLRIPPSSAETS